MIDLTANRWCMQVYALQREVEEDGPVDDVSRSDYLALVEAVRELFYLVKAKVEA